MANKLDKHFEKIILKSTGASFCEESDFIQNLWSGYGEILRYDLSGSKIDSVVVKHVKLPNKKNHPRGWNSEISHNRKIKSYKVETEFYKTFGSRCNDNCRIPLCYAVEAKGDEVFMVFEDIDAAGFPLRKDYIGWNEIELCLKWLANFHATFLETEPEGLWKTGTYWHLATRPDELKALKDTDLKKAAHKIDQSLNSTRFKTLVHGDAKLANFCFAPENAGVAAVDFQYVGGGCGMKDVAYFTGSCLNEDECEAHENNILDVYFTELKNSLHANGSAVDFESLQKEWRSLYHTAWADFHRFLKGWSPGHWKLNTYSERVTRDVIKNFG